MSNLALFGGSAVFDQVVELKSIWPPVDETTARRLQEIYYSRNWSAFHEADQVFAEAFATHHHAKYGIFMFNGTVTLQCALAAHGIGHGDEVIVPPLTWYATSQAVRHVGAKPIFVDIKPDTLCIDPAKIEAAITDRTRAVIPVHAYGAMADMERMMQLAKHHNLIVVEDCAHMHGANWDGKGVGSIGHVGSFSFQQSKTMSSGEGGICITSDLHSADRMFRMKQIGYGMGEQPKQSKGGVPKGLLCYNFRATAFQAVILQEQLKMLDSRLERYRQSVLYLEERLGESTRIRFQKREPKTRRQGYFGWVMIFDDPAYAGIPIELIQKAIYAEGLPLITAEGPIYRHALFNLDSDEYRIDQPCTVTELACSRILWLFHAYLGLGMQAVERIAAAIEKVVNNMDELKSYAANR